ncbi:hypothetical protein [Bradyrhizobium elkanii]|uniref:hypothetical protein n=1 Tax=Bradyrhizobium elkanii TaxID=29448 RepID=UPI003511F9D7
MRMVPPPIARPSLLLKRPPSSGAGRAGALHDAVIGQRQDIVDIDAVAIAARRHAVDRPGDGAVIGDDGVAAADARTVAADDGCTGKIVDRDGAGIARGAVLRTRDQAAGIVVDGTVVAALKIDRIGAGPAGCRIDRAIGDDLAVIVDREVLAGTDRIRIGRGDQAGRAVGDVNARGGRGEIVEVDRLAGRRFDGAGIVDREPGRRRAVAARRAVDLDGVVRRLDRRARIVDDRQRDHVVEIGGGADRARPGRIGRVDQAGIGNRGGPAADPHHVAAG